MRRAQSSVLRMLTATSSPPRGGAKRCALARRQVGVGRCRQAVAEVVVRSVVRAMHAAAATRESAVGSRCGSSEVCVEGQVVTGEACARGMQCAMQSAAGGAGRQMPAGAREVAAGASGAQAGCGGLPITEIAPRSLPHAPFSCV